jgi:hypothetical protein
MHTLDKETKLLWNAAMVIAKGPALHTMKWAAIKLASTVYTAALAAMAFVAFVGSAMIVLAVLLETGMVWALGRLIDLFFALADKVKRHEASHQAIPISS